MGFTRAHLESFRDAEVPDLIGPDCRLLFVGINPGLWTAATGAHFARPGNRFYPALLRAGIIERPVDPSAGMSDADHDLLIERGVGITNLVPRATARADELTPAELRAGGERLRAVVRRARPRVVAVAGITAYRTAFGHKTVPAGRQEADLEGAQLWVVPNPSGLNAHETAASLAEKYRSAAVAAGVVRETDSPGTVGDKGR
ncbi:mismatch-specific DNA-glycosylase [Rhodococcus triatomae]|uniref:TDG/mug DNA glycosylase family protein n=1 Tax=Rhodococcus triatomae TaxID=300028 RepID=A0A1G7ZHG1_9NOCA|nr:mismatch-specific DNA-glycosylase [Rhodococcus triatomae]QNG18038.1 mismatch-specific DNA-glycosylase [Rhodococcus triatomae]QNG22291.1 mismatch-specific DNA-glycosylase [Rhodococcus triatomae]SDH08163.1 TDG/mug DNA glycosylase family protein [Rhodococcus triatomae]